MEVALANHKSSKKRARQDLKIRARNLSVKKTVKTFEKRLSKSIDEKNLKLAEELLLTYASQIQKAAKKASLSAQHASRKVGQYSKKVFSLTK